MAVKLRLQRFGATKRPFYRIVASDSFSPRDGKFLEIIGTYDPLIDQVSIDDEKFEKWVQNGAQPTNTVRSLFKKYKVTKK